MDRDECGMGRRGLHARAAGAGVFVHGLLSVGGLGAEGMEEMILKAPFPYFGGKSRVAHLVWQRFGNVPNYVEPFAGSLAVLLSRPWSPGIETVNDLDCFLSNFWRAISHDPEAVASWADWPVNEADLHARHLWLVNQQAEFREKMKTDPEFYDPKIAGWWVWGLCCWIGGEWCKVTDVPDKLPHLGDAGRGINRKRPYLGGVGKGMGVHSERVAHLFDYFEALAKRLRDVRVCCGSWDRVMGPSVTIKHGVCGVFLDPPYSDSAGRSDHLYATDDMDVSNQVREWAIENGNNPLLRIALCGYEGEHQMPSDWECVAWKNRGGYGSQSNGRGAENAHRERIWFSPHCFRGNLF
jgi:DNA adenine methylase